MNKDIKKQGLPIKLWLDDMEEGAMKQAENLAMLPFAFKHIAIMPDSHQGYGMPIGGVMATKGVVIPNAVGVDIGCGMIAVKTTLTDLSTETLKRIMGEIRKVVPVGFKHQKEKQADMLMPDTDDRYRVVSKEYKSALKQIGTLGGGNHFIEIQKGDDGYIWIMIHSGSRNIGLKVATHYNKLAQELNEKWCTAVPKQWELAFLPLESEYGREYMREMNYCVDFALANRELMMDNVLFAITDVLADEIESKKREEWFHLDKPINIAHNYARMENHFGRNVMIHRKGATSANEGEFGIIPGSQGTCSYIVKGKGNLNSFKSCSHGAGRKMSRTKAINELDLEAEKKLLDDKGVIHGIRNKSDLDEAASAYKDIDAVMEHQKDLVEIVVKLSPLAVLKG